jgi:SPP1 gp7 family putative phage head morphogenesis protein
MPDLILDDFQSQDVSRALDRRLSNLVPTFHWRDVENWQHSQMFTVAKTAGYDVLDDLAAAVEDAIKNGETFDTFSKRLIPILQDAGWWGRDQVIDPLTGQLAEVQLGSLRRLQIIYDTNLRMSYSAARWLEIERVKADRPYLMYQAVLDSRTRAEHRAWSGTILPCDHQWWNTHYPPNGWNCRCTVISLSDRQRDQFLGQDGIRTDPLPFDLRSVINTRTGATEQVPEGIDPGFGYNVGKAMLAALASGG